MATKDIPLSTNRTMPSPSFVASVQLGLNSSQVLVSRCTSTQQSWRSRVFMAARPTWERVAGCDVLLPAGTKTPKAVVHFAGGLGAGAAPKTLYSTFLERVVERGDVAVIATPVGAGFDHDAIAREVAELNGSVLVALLARWGMSWIPVIGLGHSLGAKIHLLASSSPATRSLLGPRVANILIAFNNFSAAQSIPMWDALRSAAARGSGSVPPELSAVLERVRVAGSSPEALQALGVSPQVASWLASATKAVADLTDGLGSGGFTPSEAEVLRRVRTDYAVNRNLVVAYSRDTIDCSAELVPALRQRHGDTSVVLRRLAGTHITPNTPDIDPSSVRATGVDSVDASVRGAADSTIGELDDTVTVVVAFIALNLELLAEQRQLSA